ncbi:MAG: transposase [Vicinamibacterales bacterium]
MARLARMFANGVAAHVHQRGNNRADMFADTYDRVVFLLALLESSQRYKVAVHAWVLMRNHFHLLATPSSPDGLPRMMQQTGRRYVPYFNKRHLRTGGLWEGRYSAHLIHTERYLLNCHRYIELNPVRAAIVSTAEDYRWSSYRAYALGAHDPLITPHALYLASADTPLERQLLHKTRCGTALMEAELTWIRTALRAGQGDSEIPDVVSLAEAS